MKLKTRGTDISDVEVSGISPNGIWLFVQGRECFLSYAEYPWFTDATVAQIHHVKLLHGMHLHWPDLDVDLELKAIASPDSYPLKYR